MAILAITKLGDRRPSGRFVEQSFRVTTGTSQAADYASAGDLGLSWIEAIVGLAVIGTGGGLTPNFKKNGQGTQATEGDNPGDLGIEAASATVLDITVLGKP